MKAGRAAGCVTVLLGNPENENSLAGHECTDLVVRRLDELIRILETGVEVGGGG